MSCGLVHEGRSLVAPKVLARTVFGIRTQIGVFSPDDFFSDRETHVMVI